MKLKRRGPVGRWLWGLVGQMGCPDRPDPSYQRLMDDAFAEMGEQQRHACERVLSFLEDERGPLTARKEDDD